MLSPPRFAAGRGMARPGNLVRLPWADNLLNTLSNFTQCIELIVDRPSKYPPTPGRLKRQNCIRSTLQSCQSCRINPFPLGKNSFERFFGS
jgi:hypothetical protein